MAEMINIVLHPCDLCEGEMDEMDEVGVLDDAVDAKSQLYWLVEGTLVLKMGVVAP